MNKLPNHTALKEWAEVIDALARGEQTLLIRKGGLADPKFGVEADRFYLYPTYYHQPSHGAEPGQVTIRAWCEVVRSWRIDAFDTLLGLAPLVVMPQETLASRYRFRSDQALHVIGVRAWRLREPQTIAVVPAYGGCLSWISLDDEIDVEGSTAVLGDAQLEERFSEVDTLVRG